MKNNLNNYLIGIKKSFMSFRKTISIIFYWQLILTFLTFSGGNLLFLLIIGIVYLFNLIMFI